MRPALPPPLGGEGRGGGCYKRRWSGYPPPWPSPTRGEGTTEIVTAHVRDKNQMQSQTESTASHRLPVNASQAPTRAPE